jgi:non-homologous end joining protein Ku
MKDEYSERVLKFIEKKHARGRDVVETESTAKGPAQVVDLMEVLKRNLQQRTEA